MSRPLRKLNLLLRLAFGLAVFLTASAQEGPFAQAGQVGGDPPALAEPAGGYPVELEGEELYRVLNAIGPFTAKERAERAQGQILRIANDPFYSPKLIEVRINEGNGECYYRGELLGMGTLADATAHGVPVADLMAGIVNKVEGAIERYHERRRPREMLRAVISLVVAAGLLVLLLYGVRLLYRRLLARAERARAGRLSAQLKQRFGLSPDKLFEYHARGLRLLRWFLVLVVALAFLEAVFSAVPMTRGHAFAVLGYLTEPLTDIWHGILAHVGDLFFILVMLVITYYVLRLMRWLAQEASTGAVTLPGVVPEWAIPLYKILRLVVVAIAAVMIYPYIPGSSTAAFKGISLFAGALFTLGASGTAGNFIGGVVLVFMSLYRLGDRIRLGEVSGDVVEMNLLMTRLRTTKNEIISLPNSAILGGQLVNYSTRARQAGLILHTSVTIGYDTPWRQVHQMLLDAARQTDGLLQEPAAFVLQRELSDFYVAYELNAYTRNPNSMERIYSDLHQNIQDEFNRCGVQIMSPHYIADPQEAKLVPPARWEARPRIEPPRA